MSIYGKKRTVEKIFRSGVVEQSLEEHPAADDGISPERVPHLVRKTGARKLRGILKKIEAGIPLS